jgi:hypothetical protein
MTPLPIALIAAAFSAAVCADPGAIRSTPFLTAQASQQGAAAPQPKAKPAAKPRAPLPAVELTEQVMFKLMIAEVALQRGQPQVAVPAFL